ncbi:leucine--tRNA ligase [Reichenbachiella agarivorans]|uniref:Leucine--tRNA ligase n=1 Tax=Reichenbachiella agarivorans TaxID=2979464 RepID=A0ABY6CQ46_9BACT|nr:leucine--tRNA ligase [Reichenbachiella agarivorans]UXP32155.1 leucine--tRNA ligase [Reichenbachiella agarivorans]
MAEYNHSEIEKKWQQYWSDNQTFKAEVDPSKPKFYALDMFPYPSGAGLHVGHPLGYIASDIISRYKRTKGFNVLHPMGFDAFGLPAEQYAIQTGQHPAITTEENIARYKEQLKNIGFSFDWSKEVRTCDASYYKWTQWIFIQLFNSWYNNDSNHAESIDSLIQIFAKEGNSKVNAVSDDAVNTFSASDWNGYSEKEKQEILLQYRLTYLSTTTVNWCPELGTVLAQDEIKDGFSERGGFPVVKKQMKQWSMRITAYAERLLQGLDTLDWSEPLKEMQRNWIGKSQGAEMTLDIEGHEEKITVFTTRIDTVLGVTFLVLAPELELIKKITTDEQRAEVEAYVEVARNKSERDRMTNVKTVSGAFTGAYAINPFDGQKVPVWIADYVLAGYGTGAVMAVPGGDQRDYDFAKHFDLPILPIYEGMDVSKEANPTKEGKIINKGMLEGLTFKEATATAIKFLEDKGIGTGKINYRIRDAIFARQRYWGEPVPVYFKDSIPYPVDVADLPIVLPEIDKYLPTADGDPPLARAENFTYTPKGETTSYPLEMSTMPGWAGSSWYWYRYMDAQNDEAFVADDVQKYWKDVDLYIGGTEHATGHLLYSRFWNKFLFDMGYVEQEEPFKKLVNQGMIQGRSNFVYRIKGSNQFVSFNKKEEYDYSPMHVEVSLVNNDVLDTEAFKAWRPDLKDAEFILEDDKYVCGYEVEKMSKSKYNVVNPDDIIEKYGADTLRMYEMFLGPLEQFKPWNTHGIDGVSKFLRKTWRLFHNAQDEWAVSEEKATPEELKILHKAIKKIEDDINNLSLNTSVSTLMIAVNELTALKCSKKEILEDLVIILSPFAPHISEELWLKLGHKNGISTATFPAFDESLLTESTHEYPISINGKVRAKISFPTDMDKGEIEKQVLVHEVVLKWTEGKAPKKTIIVPNRIINIVV